ncbi:MAG TPA: thiosulfate oxidation carrier protein SoxY [Candidatus Dormibacteraeota bacterium]|nr:thiosulfate oxidation carrier protein SoxY [Candidatus Dormibacteraeota bacterium]
MPTQPTSATTLNRRQIVTAMGTGVMAALVASLYPRPASATPDDVKKWLAAFNPGTPTPGKITINAPDIAENGNVVPIALSVDSPMTEQSYVKTIVMAADGNPLPGVMRVDLTPANGKADVQFRMRLMKTQTVTAVALMSDGSLWSATKVIKVTIGGCGG